MLRPSKPPVHCPPVRYPTVTPPTKLSPNLRSRPPGEAADRIGKGAGVVVASNGAGAAHGAAPRAPHRGRRGIAGDVTGLGQSKLRPTGRTAAGAVGEVRQEELGALHHGVGEAGVVL